MHLASPNSAANNILVLYHSTLRHCLFDRHIATGSFFFAFFSSSRALLSILVLALDRMHILDASFLQPHASGWHDCIPCKLIDCKHDILVDVVSSSDSGKQQITEQCSPNSCRRAAGINIVCLEFFRQSLLTYLLPRAPPDDFSDMHRYNISQDRSHHTSLILHITWVIPQHTIMSAAAAIYYYDQFCRRKYTTIDNHLLLLQPPPFTE